MFSHWHAFYRSYCHASLIIGIYSNEIIYPPPRSSMSLAKAHILIYAASIPTFLELNAIGFIFCLLSRSFMFIASAILFILYKCSKGYLSFCPRTLYIKGLQYIRWEWRSSHISLQVLHTPLPHLYLHRLLHSPQQEAHQ